MRTLLALLLLTAATPPAVIQGLVTDAQTGHRLPSAQVIVVWTTNRGITNNLGQYKISGVPAGTVQLAASRDNFQSQKQTVTVPATGVVTVNFVLKRAVPNSPP